MKWYRSASAYVSLKWIGDTMDGINYTIPAFTMVTDETKSIVYTLVGYVPTVATQEFSVANLILPASGKTINAKAIQGIAVKYDINGDTIITPNHLDQDNRIYFNVSNIAENGIFITNTGMTNYESWIRKDNLLVEDYGNTYYKFGVTADGATCYLEFPDDADSIMKDGIEITYIRSDGENGNLTAQQLSNFYSDLTVNSSLGDTMVLNAQNVQITNYFASTAGYNYESIDSAYKNYKRSIGTFNTLITLRDYLNYIVTNDLASNGFCCDRSQDIQCTYDIMSYNNGIDSISSVIETEDNEPVLTAFSLKLYLLKYFADVSTANIFNGTFQMMSDSQLANVEDYLLDVKSLQHDYEQIESTSTTQSHFCFFKNKYPLSCTIIPQYKVSFTQENEIKENVRKALYKYLNSQEIEFGEKISTDYLYKIITEADSRIKNIMLDSPIYTTYAVYLENGIYKEIPISGNINDSCELQLLDEDNISITSYTATINSDTYINKLVSDGIYGYSTITFIYNSGWKLNGNSVTLSDYGIALSGSDPSSGDKIIVNISKQTQFRDEILAKSILAGVTPFLIQEEEFDYRLDESDSTIYTNIKSLSSNVDITVGNGSGQTSSYVLRNNEGIKFFAPNLLQKAIYNNYVKFESHLNGTVGANQYYELQSGEYVIFYWKSSASAADYSFAAYGEGCILMPTFILSSTQSSTTTTQELVTELQQLPSPQILTSQDFSLNPYQSQAIAALTATENILSSDKAISYYIVNKVTINTSMYCYWVLNDITISNNIETYQLFDIGQTEYILKSGEYFFYTDNEMNSFVSLGTGTKIIRTTSSDIWSVRALDLPSITLNGITALQSYWYSPTYSIVVEEQQFIQLNDGYTLRVVPKEAQTSWQIVISSSGCNITATSASSLADFDIYYLSNSATAEEQKIPDFNFSSSASWDAKSLLNINTSVNVEQILLSGQSITLTDSSDNETTLTGGNITGISPAPVYYPTVFKTNQTLSFAGEDSYDTITFDSTLNPIYMNLYKYSKQITRSAIVKYIGDSASVMILSGTSSSNQSNPPRFSLPIGEYLIPVVTPDLPDNVYMTVEITDLTTSTTQILHPIYDSTLSKLSEATLYPMYFSVSTAGHNYSIVVKLVDASSSAVNAPNTISLTFKNPYRFEASTRLSKILALIKMFDIGNIFDYTYVGDSNSIINDPLNANSFLDVNHIFNKYTICQLDTDSLTGLQVSY